MEDRQHDLNDNQPLSSTNSWKPHGKHHLKGGAQWDSPILVVNLCKYQDWEKWADVYLCHYVRNLWTCSVQRTFKGTRNENSVIICSTGAGNLKEKKENLNGFIRLNLKRCYLSPFLCRNLYCSRSAKSVSWHSVWSGCLTRSTRTCNFCKPGRLHHISSEWKCCNMFYFEAQKIFCGLRNITWLSFCMGVSR